MKECECAGKRVHYQCSFSFWKTPVFQYSVQEFASSHQLHDHEHVFTIIINLANRTIMIHELNVCNSKEVHHLFFLQTVQDSRQSLSGYQSTRKPKRRRWSTIVLVWINSWIGLLLTVTEVLTTCVVEIFRVKASRITSVDGIQL